MCVSWSPLPEADRSSPAGTSPLLQGHENIQLLHHSQRVPGDPAFSNFSVGDANDRNSLGGDLLPSRSNPQQHSFVCAASRPAGGHLIVLGEDVIHRKSQIWKSTPIHVDVLPQ